MSRPRIAISCGEPAGVGPEIAVRAALQSTSAACLLIGDATQLQSLASVMSPHYPVQRVTSAASWKDQPGQLAILDCPLAVTPVPGQLDARNGKPVLDMLDAALAAAMAGDVDAIVTAPVQKSTINDAGIAFTGHTEYLAEKTHTPQVVMMLAGRNGKQMLRVALATTHLALADVPRAITRDSLRSTLAIIHQDLITRFGIADPRILVTGLNPHAGEEGYLGREEIDVIRPVIDEARARGWQVSGPYPADTLFQPRYLDEADCVLAMYHDQGLPVLKFATFGQGVNITLGLPVIRTSVDHGTALDKAAAGCGHADATSMVEAIAVAAQMATSRQ
jgi:4-hydroxythreonine-4-phosphate dehydrogenase